MNELQRADKLSFEQAIQLIRDKRNLLIRSFFNDEKLKTFFTTRYKNELSNVRRAFLQKELKELLISPVDLTHYASLIVQLRDSDLPSINNVKEELFYKELEAIFSKYNY